MITKLEDLTMGQFIDLLSGNADVLKSRHEIVSELKVAIVTRNIIFEYRMIADKTGAKSYLSHVDDVCKAHIDIYVFRVCKEFIDMDEPNCAREVLSEYGVYCEAMSDERVAAEAESRLERAIDTLGRLENDTKASGEESVNVRESFDEQTAALMAHFKFQIDISKMKATQYAHLVSRHNREIDARLKAMNKR